MNEAIGPKSSYDFVGLGELKAKAASDASDDKAIKKVAQQFEAMLLQMMMKSMRDTVEKTGLFDSQATETFEQMYDQQLVMAIAERGSTGLAQMVEKFIRQSHSQVSAIKEQTFSLENKSIGALPLNGISDKLPLPEGATREFLLNRSLLRLQAGDNR